MSADVDLIAEMDQADYWTSERGEAHRAALDRAVTAEAALRAAGLEPPTNRWVVGFMFDDDADEVVLIRKNRPAWQAGRLNGVGGKVEPGDTSIEEAMVREFAEETGVLTNPGQWHHFLDLTWDEGLVHFFRAFVPHHVLTECRTMTDETIERHRVHGSDLRNATLQDVTPNLSWLIPLAVHRYDTYRLINVVETATSLRGGTPTESPAAPEIHYSWVVRPFPTLTFFDAAEMVAAVRSAMLTQCWEDRNGRIRATAISEFADEMIAFLNRTRDSRHLNHPTIFGETP